MSNIKAIESTAYITYEQFGAVGDGKHDDMPAICAAHEAANAQGLPVRARDEATYYIGGKALIATIKTNVDFGKAHFIIDDRALENVKLHVFHIASDYPIYTPEITAVTKGQQHIDFPHDGKRTYVRVFDSSKKIFIRKGENATPGVDISDCFIVSGNGDIENRINYDYNNISRIVAHCVEDEPIVIEGGIFTTIANQHERVYNYHARGFNITRANTTVKNMTHYVEGEGEDGAPYNGFLAVNDTVDVTLCDILLTPHKKYYTKDSTPERMNGMGTYELIFGAAIGVKLLRVTQSRDIADTNYWGLIGTNFCKDLYIEDCVMSRFDAHMGVTNTIIKRSRIGHQSLALIGYGDFYIEDSYVNGFSFLALRGDYGSHWDGTFVAKNCIWEPKNEGCNHIVGANNSGDHDFGYVSCMPRSIVIDGLRIMDGTTDKNKPLYILPNYDPAFTPDKPYAYETVKELRCSGIVSDAGREILIYENEQMYHGLDAEVK